MYKRVKENLTLYFIRDNSLLKRFDHVSIDHIPRLENQEVNDLATISLGYEISKERLEDLVEIEDFFSIIEVLKTTEEKLRKIHL